ncbi:riboflavin biosynthesis protein RibBA-like [Schistocerca gregaria]|uniref:riboflavin biosynthesis protein RibBA-like n=1 Tax=Schistocerca gregaria TaxID=7010 RepID=UPI00211E1164|nr:riboflavin biosynthesis protein RibBA-like [Schistocerca gregaria]
MGEVMFSPVEEVIEEIRCGRYVVIMDDEKRENEGDLIMAAEFATSSAIAFYVNHTTGILCAPITLSRAQQLNLSIMVPDPSDPMNTAFTISTDSIFCTTGVSASDRAMTFRQLANKEEYQACHFRYPGHVFPLIAHPDGIAGRAGHTEAAMELCKLAKVRPVAVIGELVNKDGTMKRTPDCWKFAQKYGLKMTTIKHLTLYLSEAPSRPLDVHLPTVSLYSECTLPIMIESEDLGVWTLKCFYMHSKGRFSICLIKGDVSAEHAGPVLTRVHSECFTGDVLGSKKCDCRSQLITALKAIASINRGILIYQFGHEGRGIGLPNKILAYHLQQSSHLDTYAANRNLGFSEDRRDYQAAVGILKALRVQKINLMTCNRDKILALSQFINIVIYLEGQPNEYNSDYLQAKRKHNLLDEKDVIHQSAFQQFLTGRSNDLHVPDHANELVGGHQKPSTPPPPFQHKQIPFELFDFKRSDVTVLKILIVYTMWNHSFVSVFKDKIHEHLVSIGVPADSIRHSLVPGSFEIPYGVMAASKNYSCDAIICTGVLIKGDTIHFEVISYSVAHSLLSIQSTSNIPVINAILNCTSEQQASVRCHPNSSLPKSIAYTAAYMGLMHRHTAFF